MEIKSISGREMNGPGWIRVCVEALGGGQHLGVVAKVPLAKAGGGVAMLLEVVSNGLFVRMQSMRRVGKEHALVHAHPKLWFHCMPEGTMRAGNKGKGDSPDKDSLQEHPPTRRNRLYRQIRQRIAHQY